MSFLPIIKHIEDYLIIRPFPQFKSGLKELPQLWEEYRHTIISIAGAVFVFGNKEDKIGNIVLADGVYKEFEIAISHGLRVIPVGATGFMAQTIWEKIMGDYGAYYPNTQN